MERQDNSLLSSFTESNIRFEENRKQLIFLHTKRICLYLIDLKGKHEGKDGWHFVLVDLDKKKEFLEKSGKVILDGNDYVKILDSGWGCDVPDVVNNKTEKFIKDLETKLFIFKLQEDQDIYYVLCDADMRNEIAASRTAVEVRRCARVLYSSIDEDPPEALWDVIEKGYFEPTISNFVIVNERNLRRGIEAARGGDVQEVRDFLKEVGDVDWTDGNGWTMLHHAAHGGDLGMIRTLKGMNANTQVRDNICGRKPIHIAARQGHARAVELFLINSDSVDDADKSGWTPLHYAAWKGDSNTVKYLILKKANTEIRDRYLGKKPIHVAVTEGHTDIVRIFLDNGANIDDADAEGRTLLYHSAFAGRFETAQFLIDRKANVDIANKFGSKPIHISENCAQVTELLLNHGADIESRDRLGKAPLLWAAECGGINVFRMLVEKGANLMATDNQGETAFDIAMAKQPLEKASCIAEIMCQVFRSKDKYIDALNVYEKLFKIQKEILAEDHLDTLKTQSNIALMLYEQGKYEEALETLNVILSKRQDILLTYNFYTLCTKYEKGRVLVAQWKLEEAMEIFKEVFKSWQDTLGAGHHRTLSVARELAFVHFKKCEFDEALKICEDLYEKRKLSSGVNDPVTLQALQDVAIVLVNKGENRNALRILKDVFAKRKECLGARHPETISAGYHIATVEKRLKDTQADWWCCLQ